MPSTIVQEAYNNKRGVLLINGSALNGTQLPITATIDPTNPASYVKIYESNYQNIQITNATTSGSTITYTTGNQSPPVPVGTQILVKGLLPNYYNGLFTVLTSGATTLTVAANQFVTTAASGDGTTATISFSRAIPIIPVGTTITVAGVTPAGYNATATVTASTTTSVSYLNATTGAQTVAGTITQTGAMTANYTGSFSSAAPAQFRRWVLFNDNTTGYIYVRLNNLNTSNDNNYFMIKFGENFGDQIDGTAIWAKTSDNAAVTPYRLELSGIPIRQPNWMANGQEVLTGMGGI